MTQSDDLTPAEVSTTVRVHGAVADRLRLLGRCEVAVIGAGPYGLAAATHLKAAGIATRAFGHTMAFWRANMPRGMKLRHATSISDPEGRFSLDAFARMNAAASVRPLPIEDFVAYGEWFQRHAIPDLDQRRVTRVAPGAKGFELQLEDGDTVAAARVVIALGLKNQDFRPAEFAGLPERLLSYSCEHADFAQFRGRRVAVVGRGQSACESAVFRKRPAHKLNSLAAGPFTGLVRKRRAKVRPASLGACTTW
jgi:FAD-dependent urate hydroxylase